MTMTTVTQVLSRTVTVSFRAGRRRKSPITFDSSNSRKLSKQTSATRTCVVLVVNNYAARTALGSQSSKLCMFYRPQAAG